MSTGFSDQIATSCSNGYPTVKDLTSNFVSSYEEGSGKFIKYELF